MLILTRKKGERIMIGDNIFITLIEIKGKQARIGIDAPKNLKINREEVYDRMMEGSRMAQLAV